MVMMELCSSLYTLKNKYPSLNSHYHKVCIMSRNMFSRLFRRPWIGGPFSIWIIVSIIYYWWLLSKIKVLESQNKAFKTQLLSQKLMTVKQMSMPYVVPDIPDAIGTICETVHIALVCMGKCTRLITPMLKSILHHRQNPLHFHLVVDGTSHHTISKLFDTWDLPDVRYTCYNAEDQLTQVRWVPTSHYSGIYPLVKLLFPDVLTDELTQVIVLDSDLTFLCDVAELWSMFRNMSDEQFIGLVENESNWYIEANRWPALGRGYNTGVMLLDLKKIRMNTDWTRLWTDAVNHNIGALKQTNLADQDVINVIIKNHPRFLYNMSCQYNVQMSTKTLAKGCYGEDRNNVKIIHWNSPGKYNIKIRDADFFRNIHQSYVNFDGNLLREKLHRCSIDEPVTSKVNNPGLCLSFRSAQSVKLRTHLFYLDYIHITDDFDVTLVLQLSMDRLQFLERLVKYWEGPLSVAIYLSDCEVTKLETFIKDWSDTLSSRKNIGYHLVFKQDSVHYPVNYLRNVALENVNTPYVFLMDADFVPMPGLYQHLKNTIKLVNPYPQKKCLVVPAFETQRYRASPPSSKGALLARMSGRNGPADISPFRAREWPKGHRATNYTRWISATAPYEVEWQSDYEPYLVVHRSVPKYDTRFSGFGWNKVSHSVELRAQGYRAVVLPGAFVLHTPHAPSHDITAFRADPRYRICLALLKQEFLDDLKRKYNVTFEEPSKQEGQY